jgi:toluene monooxygenase system protein D
VTVVHHNGPVFGTGEIVDAMIDALLYLNARAEVQDFGGYRRVLVPDRCRLTRVAVEERLGYAVHLPSLLERTMSSFRGRFTVTEDEARWESWP